MFGPENSFAWAVFIGMVVVVVLITILGERKDQRDVARGKPEPPPPSAIKCILMLLIAGIIVWALTPELQRNTLITIIW